MQFRRGRDRQRRILRSVNHGTAVAPRGVARGRDGTRKVEGRSAYLNYNIPTGGTQGPLPALRRPPSLPYPCPPCISPLRPLDFTQAACRNLINLPVASRLAPCRHSEILYPSHPLKSEPAVERTVAFALRHSQSAITALGRPLSLSLSRSPPPLFFIL